MMSLVAPCSLAVREWWSLYGVDVCGQWSLAGLLGWLAVVRWWSCALVRVVLLV